MKKILVLLLLTQGVYAQTPATNAAYNYSSFTAEKKIITTELQSLTDKQFYEHPEYGVLPFNAPCTGLHRAAAKTRRNTPLLCEERKPWKGFLSADCLLTVVYYDRRRCAAHY